MAVIGLRILIEGRQHWLGCHTCLGLWDGLGRAKPAVVPQKGNSVRRVSSTTAYIRGRYLVHCGRQLCFQSLWLTLHQSAIQVQAIVYMLSPAPQLAQILSHQLLDQVYQQSRAIACIFGDDSFNGWGCTCCGWYYAELIHYNLQVLHLMIPGLRTTSMGLCICSHYCSLDFHLGVHYIYDIQYTSNTAVRHRVSIKVM